jgi:hypothetical protein
MPVTNVTQVEGYVTINFERTDGTYTLVDAVVLTEAEYNNTTPEQIEAMEQVRWDSWYAIVTAPSEEQPTEEVTNG